MGKRSDGRLVDEKQTGFRKGRECRPESCSQMSMSSVHTEMKEVASMDLKKVLDRIAIFSLSTPWSFPHFFFYTHVQPWCLDIIWEGVLYIVKRFHIHEII